MERLSVEASGGRSRDLCMVGTWDRAVKRKRAALASQASFRLRLGFAVILHFRFVGFKKMGDLQISRTGMTIVVRRPRTEAPLEELKWPI